MKIAFVADPLDGLDPSVDTTVGLMHAAQDPWRRGLGHAGAAARSHARPCPGARPPGAARAVPAARRPSMDGGAAVVHRRGATAGVAR